MYLLRSVIVLTLVVSMTALPAYHQSTRNERAQYTPSSADPFSISVGSSFSASTGSSGGRGGSGRSITPATIDLDFNEALRTIISNHVDSGKLNENKLTDDSIDSMLKMLDPHSNYFTPEQFRELLGEHESRYSGTGSSIAGFNIDGKIATFVISTFAGSPAEKAGLRFGDRILQVNGQDMLGRSPDAVRSAVRGKSGTQAVLTVERANGRTLKIDVKRDLVKEPAVPAGFIIGRNTGYIDLTGGFSNATFTEFETALEGLRKKGATSLIIDLRGNGGGILSQAVKVAEKFLPAGATIVSQKGRFPSDERVWRAGKDKFEKLPLVVLVDNQTASAAEILAGALQDNDRAVIVGRKTFGKGLVQSVLDLPAGAGLTLTAARYYLPSGRSIQREYAGKGIYDYYHDRGRESSIDIPHYAAKTRSGRVVYGGDGITPDLPSAAEPMTERQFELLDVVFPFVRRVIGNDPAKENLHPDRRTGSTVDGLQQNLPVDSIRLYGQLFEGSATTPELQQKLASERNFVQKMIGYYLAMAASGPEAARHFLLISDPQVIKAAAAVDRAITLFGRTQQKGSQGR